MADSDRDVDPPVSPDEETGLVLVLIPGGEFSMGAVRPSAERPEGSPCVDPHAEEDEGPVHRETVAPFFLSKYEMTQGQWERVTGENPSLYAPSVSKAEKPRSLLHPVEQVTWKDARRTLFRLALQLPTETQWEYAARRGPPASAPRLPRG